MTDPAAVPLDYAAPRPAAGPPRAWPPVLTLAPVAAFAGLLVAIGKVGTKWMGIGQGWERLVGSTWIAVAAWGLVWVVVLAVRPKRWTHVVAVVVHTLVVLLTVLPPGCIAVAWLMHWLTGPGA